MRLEVKRCQTDRATRREKRHLWISYITSERGQYSLESPWLTSAEGTRRSEVASVADASAAVTHTHRAWGAAGGKWLLSGLGHSWSVLHDQDHMLSIPDVDECDQTDVFQRACTCTCSLTTEQLLLLLLSNSNDDNHIRSVSRWETRSCLEHFKRRFVKLTNLRLTEG